MSQQKTADAARFALPDGRKLACTNLPQTAVLWQEITERSPYGQSVRGLGPGDVIIDVGANVGLTAIFFADQVPGVRVIAFEPAAECYDCLADNLARYAPEATAVCAAVGAQEGTQEFTYYPNSPAQSSLYADAAEDRWLTKMLMTNSRMNERMRSSMLTDQVLDQMFTEQRREVPVTTVAAAFEKHGIDEIALLKVDVERAELEVLTGVGDDNWPRIARVVLEVHDIDGRLRTVRELLADRGFTLLVSQDSRFRGTNVHNVLAVRGGRP